MVYNRGFTVDNLMFLISYFRVSINTSFIWMTNRKKITEQNDGHLSRFFFLMSYALLQSFCKYKFYLDDKEEKTKEIDGTMNPDFNYCKLFKFKPVTAQVSYTLYLDLCAVLARWCIRLQMYPSIFVCPFAAALAVS